MTMKEVSVFLALAGLALAAPHFDERIIGGSDAVCGEYPYIVSLRNGGRHSCGASILNKNHILTAAHCVDSFRSNPESFSIQYGTVDISTDDNLISVEKITIHSKYISWNDYANDIAILKLESDIKFGANAQPVKLPEASTVPAGDVEAVLIGWGRNITGGPVQDILKKISYTKFSDAHCQGTEPKYNPNYHVCAGIPGGGKGQCNGDSGGPLTISGVQYGIVSWSVKPCANADHPGILTSVAKYLDWIQEHIED